MGFTKAVGGKDDRLLANKLVSLVYEDTYFKIGGYSKVSLTIDLRPYGFTKEPSVSLGNISLDTDGFVSSFVGRIQAVNKDGLVIEIENKSGSSYGVEEDSTIFVGLIISEGL